MDLWLFHTDDMTVEHSGCRRQDDDMMEAGSEVFQWKGDAVLLNRQRRKIVRNLDARAVIFQDRLKKSIYCGELLSVLLAFGSCWRIL